METKANARQVGGAHYGGGDYQHWDWVADAGMSYLAGTATKYVARWRKKNGKEDLEKALHYVDKIMERDNPFVRRLHDTSRFWQFVRTNDIVLGDAEILYMCMTGQYEEARTAILGLLEAS